MEGIAGVTGAIGPQSRARAVMLEAVRLDHESQFLVSEVRDREESWSADNELRGQAKTGRECECPKYGLERVLRAAVGVGRHPPDGDGPGSASIAAALRRLDAVTIPDLRAESAIASPSSNGRTRAQSRTVRKGPVTPASRSVALRLAHRIWTPSTATRT